MVQPGSTCFNWFFKISIFRINYFSEIPLQFTGDGLVLAFFENSQHLRRCSAYAP